ncbi:hypothetical protein TIFTF001_010240 [Ficus carica]|uniref:KIB1-4 beta-propeller domain-containing protein n=1 Tax=Ficus carica TaxID=3494 RepID=A0AA88AIM9_FICCA|nr:hypothetical protein TIFTF001_010240 [Ficus carica]
MSCMHDILQHNNQIYVSISGDGELVSFDVTNSCNPIVKLVASGIPRKRFRQCDVERYLVESSEGELLQVERYMRRQKKDEGRETKMFRIFRLDFDATKWIEIESLGGDSLFLGDNSSISVLASNFTGCQSNSIYEYNTRVLHGKGRKK